MNARMRATLTALLATGIALTVVTELTAVADTNKSQQTSNDSGPTAPLLSPDGARPESGQTNRQTMKKDHSTNWSLIDYFGEEEVCFRHHRHRHRQRLSKC
ncbi:hypothetical protein [Streptomyces flavidovirens]|uniref:hypothetical protein n=1 Tax=Streptomyces flavidovirens TaxID=67298 RepID=UPI0004299DDB|nr:hypothetical protein [Streptomyces flavidovirens]